MDFLKQIKLAYFILQRFGHESLLDNFFDFAEFADKRFQLVSLDNDINNVGIIFQGLKDNLSKLKSGELNEENVIIPELKTYYITFQERYNQLTEYTYGLEYKGPNESTAIKMFEYELQEGNITPSDDGKLLSKSVEDTEFVDEGVLAIDEKKDNIRESTKKIVREIYQRKLKTIKNPHK